MKRTLITMVATLIAALLPAGGCARLSPPAAMDLVPIDATAAIRVHWQTVRSDPLLAQLAPIAEMSRLMERAAVRTEDVDSVVLFSRASGGDAAIIQLRVPVEAAFADLGRKGWAAERIKTVAMYRENATGVVAAMVGQKLMAFGSQPNIESIADSSMNRSFLDRSEFHGIDNLQGAQIPIVMALAWPQTARDAANAAVMVSASVLKFMGVEALGILVEKIGIGRAMTIHCSREAGGIKFRLQAITEDEQSASLIIGALTLVQGMAALVPASGGRPSPADSFRTLTLDRKGTALSVGLLMTERDLER